MEGGGNALEGDADQDEDDGISEDVVVIIDNGSGVCKAGLSSQTHPGAVFPSVVGTPRKAHRSSLERDMYFGDDVLPFDDQTVPDVYERCMKLSVNCPIENGIIENFEHMESLWAYAFDDKLGVNPSRHPVLLTEPPYNPKPNRERMVEIMFEAFGVPVLNISIQGVLALFGSGRMTGLVLDSGEGVTHTLPIFQGFGLNHCINRMNIAGRELNTVLAKLLAQEGTSLTKTVEQHHVRRMKEQHCYVAVDPNSEFAEPATYRMPDGREVTLTDERWKAPESLFTPTMVGFEPGTLGVAGMVWDSINRCDIDVKRTLLNNVVLSGGSTMFPGFTRRLTHELRSFAPPAVQAEIKVVVPKDQTSEHKMDQRYAVWSGAQVFAGLKSMQEDQWVSAEEYYEYGVQLIHEKMAVKYS